MAGSICVSRDSTESVERVPPTHGTFVGKGGPALDLERSLRISGVKS